MLQGDPRDLLLLASWGHRCVQGLVSALQGVNHGGVARCVTRLCSPSPGTAASLCPGPRAVPQPPGDTEALRGGQRDEGERCSDKGIAFSESLLADWSSEKV